MLVVVEAVVLAAAVSRLRGLTTHRLPIIIIKILRSIRNNKPHHHRRLPMPPRPRAEFLLPCRTAIFRPPTTTGRRLIRRRLPLLRLLPVRPPQPSIIIPFLTPLIRNNRRRPLIMYRLRDTPLRLRHILPAASITRRYRSLLIRDTTARLCPNNCLTRRPGYPRVITPELILTTLLRRTVLTLLPHRRVTCRFLRRTKFVIY